MTSMNVSLPDPMRDWVQDRIARGDYLSADDYIRDLIRRDKAVSEQWSLVNELLIEGEESGVSSRKVTNIMAALKRESKAGLAAPNADG